MFVSYLTPPQWLNLILGLLHLVNPQIWGLKKKFNCSLQQPTEILRDKEYLRWFFDLCFVFVTHGRGLRKITPKNGCLDVYDRYNHIERAAFIFL